MPLPEHYNCLLQLFNDTGNIPGYCTSTFDAVLCWPQTPPNTTISLDCPLSINSIMLSPGKAFRYCHPDGKWDTVGNYSACVDNSVDENDIVSPLHAEIMYWIYVVGYILSLIFCTVALLIFIHYKSLSCLRNRIHTNIVACFAVHNVTWLLYALLTIHFDIRGIEEIMLICSIPMLILKYCICAAFFWMFVEGSFLFINVLFGFYSQRIRFWMCSTIGWGIPALLLLINTTMNFKEVISHSCTDWHHASMDRIILIPILFIIVANIIFLLVILYVLLAKLKLTTPGEFERISRGFRALIVLCPLLGVNYAFVLIQPTSPYWLSLAVSYYSVIISSFQGCLVAIFFCFKNKEIEKQVCRQVLPKFGLLPRSQSTTTEELKLMRPRPSTATTAGGAQQQHPSSTSTTDLLRSPFQHKSSTVVVYGDDGQFQRMDFNKRRS